MVVDAQTVVLDGSAVLALTSWPSGHRYWFDHATYDAAADRLHLTSGPPTAASACMTPEGHVVRTAAPGDYVCGLVINDLRRRLARHGRITLTLGDLERLSLSVQDVAEAISARSAA